MRKRSLAWTLVASTVLAGCGGENTKSAVTPPGSETGAKT